MLVNEELVKVLVCPITGLPLFYDTSQNMLVNQDKSYAYHVKDAIPLIIAEMAVKLNEAGNKQ